MALIKTKESRIRILIVDDEESILQLYANILRPDHISGDFGWEKSFLSSTPIKSGKILDVTLCKNTQEALQVLYQSQHDPFSLIFLDVHLGKNEENGIALADKIRKLDNNVQIVLVTGDSNINITQIALDIPPKDKLFYLSKPFKTMEIRQFVESLSAKWFSEKQLFEMQVNLENLIQERTQALSESNRRLITEIEHKKKIEESLRQSEENFKKMIEENADSIMIVDFEGKVQFVNPAAERLFQIKKEELLFKDFEFPLVSGDRSEIAVRSKPNEELVCEMRVVDTEWHGKRASLASLRDITERKKLEERLYNSLERNQVVMKGTIQVIARFLEMKDPYTAGHQKRVAELAFRIAGSAGLNEHEQEGIHMAAMIHDIGKISIPSEILSKPGKLSDIEYDLIKTHSKTGFDILKEIEFPWPVAAIVLQHHERLDGTGYPDGIKNGKILFPSRILTVADVMEAISSHRPYRAALGTGKGIEHIKEFSGRYYDPQIVDICVSLFNDENFQFKTKGLQARESSDLSPSTHGG
jgi:putative nucleotidyltransferase with HDIG domain